jgi:Ca2+-binding RTX toxin-like protein
MVDNSSQNVIQAPAADETVRVVVTPGDNLRLDFNLNDASGQIDGQDLILNFANGGQLVLVDFFLNYATANTALIAGNDQILLAQDLFGNLAALQNVQPAEGPGNNNPIDTPINGSGANFNPLDEDFTLPEIRSLDAPNTGSSFNNFDFTRFAFPANNNLADLGFGDGGNGGSGTGGGNNPDPGTGGGNNPGTGGGNNPDPGTGGGNNPGTGGNPDPGTIPVVNVPPPSAFPLFTPGNNTVDLNNVTAGNYFAETQYDARDGDDAVILPNTDALANAAGFIGNVFHGGDGNDTITGGDRADIIFGDGGNDILSGGNNIDVIRGGGGDDTINGGNDYDELYGDGGNDTINAGPGDSLIRGGEGNDTITGGDGANTIYGDAGNDQIFGNRDIDYLYGGAGDDVIYGGDEVVIGGSLVQNPGLGNFDIITPPGDTILAGAGNDTVYGGTGDDFIRGDAGNDILNGDDGKDKIYGDAGNDIINGGNGDDLIYDGAGDDIIRGGQGFDTIFLSSGADQVIWQAGDLAGSNTPDHISGFQTGVDVLNLAGLLTGYNGNITEFVRFQDAGSFTRLQINSDGNAGPNGWQTTAVLQGVTFGGNTVKYSDIIAT